jgi:hypothetical protein
MKGKSNMDSIRVGNLTLNSNVLSASALEGKYDKTGGEISGNVSVMQHDLSVLSGDIV